MNTEILFQGSYAMLKVELKRGEEIKAEPGAMVAMTEGIEMKVKKSSKGFFKSLKTKLLGGETFLNTYFRAETQKGSLFLAPKSPGSIAHITMDGSKGFILEKGAFLASSPSITLDVKFQGFSKGFFNREGFFLIKVQGIGDLFLNCFGGLERIQLEPGQRFVVDNGHLVAFSSNTDYRITKAGGWLSSVFSGEGLVLEFTGPGEIYIQSRNPEEFGKWLITFIPVPTPSGPARRITRTASTRSTPWNDAKYNDEREETFEEKEMENEPEGSPDESFDDDSFDDSFDED